MRKTLRRALNRLGFDIVRVTTYHQSIGQHLSNVIAGKGIDAVLDVGANTGQYGLLLRSIGFEGYIYSFEPVRAVYERLAEAASGDDKWHCFNLALGSEAEEKEINVYSSHVFSSFLEANAYSKGIWTSLNRSSIETVEVDRLDRLLPTLPDREKCARFLLKMDTQGFDLQVFRGATAALPAIVALQSELGLIEVYEGTPDPYEVLREFNAQGYHISGMYPINRDQSLAVIEYDCVLVRR
jgi:FkbM family methyltransferase